MNDAHAPLRPMSEFDPSQPAMVHDQLNDRTFRWDPDWKQHFAEHHMESHNPGVVEWDGLLLDGWRELRGDDARSS